MTDKKVALITAGGSGTGAATARRLGWGLVHIHSITAAPRAKAGR